MNKKSREVQPLYAKIDKGIIERLESVRLKMGISKTKFVEDALLVKLKNVGETNQVEIKRINKKKLASEFVNLFRYSYKYYPSKKQIELYTGLNRQDIAYFLKTRFIKKTNEFPTRTNWKVHLASTFQLKGRFKNYDTFLEKWLEILSRENPEHIPKLDKDSYEALEHFYKISLDVFSRFKLSKKERRKLRFVETFNKLQS